MSKHIMSSPREKQLKIVRTLKKTDRYKMMISAMKEVIRYDPKLNAEERNLISRPYKALINERRDSLRTIASSIQKENPESIQKIEKLQNFQVKVASELSNICTEFLQLIDSKLIVNASDHDSKVFYLQLKADTYRYLCELKDVKNEADYIEKATDSYNQAINICLENFSKNHPISLRIHLNYSVFLFEILNKKEEALSLLEAIFSDCMKEAISEEQNKQILTEAQQSESRMLLQLMRDNLTIWQKDDAELE